MNTLITKFTFFLLLVFSIAFGQTTKKITGRIVNEVNSPVKRIKVSTSFDSETTDDEGRYELDLSKCYGCAIGQRISIATYNEEYGLFKKDIVLAKDLEVEDIIIPRKPNITGIIGIVKDAKTKKPVRDLKVRIFVEGSTDVDETIKTDDYGMYRFVLRKDKVGNIKYITIVFSDERYIPKNETRNIATFIETYLEPDAAPAIEITVGGYRKTQIKVHPGDLVRIKASGNVRVGTWLGNSDPDGISAGVAGIPIDNYSINSGIKHGALVYKISGDTDWKFAGKELEFVAQKEGYLEFQVNDKEQGNNSGNYNIKVTVKN